MRKALVIGQFVGTLFVLFFVGVTVLQVATYVPFLRSEEVIDETIPVQQYRITARWYPRWTRFPAPRPLSGFHGDDWTEKYREVFKPSPFSMKGTGTILLMPVDTNNHDQLGQPVAVANGGQLERAVDEFMWALLFWRKSQVDNTAVVDPTAKDLLAIVSRRDIRYSPRFIGWPVRQDWSYGIVVEAVTPRFRRTVSEKLKFSWPGSF